MPKLLDIQVDEARKIAMVQHEINQKWMYKPADLRNLIAMRDELTTKMHDIGFIVEFEQGTGQPCIVGRVDTRLEKTLQEEGHDFERKQFDARRVTSAELRKEGVNTDLLA